MPDIDIADIEAAINYWRARTPASDGTALSAEVNALAQVYGQLVHGGRTGLSEDLLTGTALQAWSTWFASTPDTPCIAICSTSQGDAHCKGCGRSFDEVQRWTAMTPAEKRAVWRRIETQGIAWRFNRYAERAGRTSGLLPNS